jgi:hypothetical protein
MKTELEKAAEKYNPVKKLDGEFIRQAFKDGAKWQAERMYSEKEVLDLLLTWRYTNHDLLSTKEWFEKFKK